MTLVFGGLSYPLVANGGAIRQPFTDAYLPYLKDAINAYAGSAFADVMRGKVSGQPATLACQEVGIVDPGFQLVKTTFRTPYLALYVEDGTASEETMRWDMTETKYALCYVLPPLPIDTIQQAAVPLLKAMVGLLILLFKAGEDPSHNSGADVTASAGITAVRLGRWSIVAETLGDDMKTAQAFPMLRAEVFVKEQEGYDPNGTDLSRVDTALDHASGDGTYPDAVQIYTVPTLEPRVARALETHMHTLRFFAVEDADAFSPPATRIGRVTPIGKTRQSDGSLTLDGGISTITLADEHANADLGFLRGEVLGGRIKLADSNTARLLDLPFDGQKKAETLPPPAVKESK